MTWLGIGLLVSLHFLAVGLAVSVWRLCRQMEQVASALKVWDNPASLATPSPEPGTTWAPTDAEVAALEQKMAADSQQRVRASRRTSQGSTPASAARRG